MRKVNPAHQSQKEYFARARARTVEPEATEENGSPPFAFYQYPDPPSSQCSHASIRSDSSSGRRTLFPRGASVRVEQKTGQSRDKDGRRFFANHQPLLSGTVRRTDSSQPSGGIRPGDLGADEAEATCGEGLGSHLRASGDIHKSLSKHHLTAQKP